MNFDESSRGASASNTPASKPSVGNQWQQSKLNFASIKTSSAPSSLLSNTTQKNSQSPNASPQTPRHQSVEQGANSTTPLRNSTQAIVETPSARTASTQTTPVQQQDVQMMSSKQVTFAPTPTTPTTTPTKSNSNQWMKPLVEKAPQPTTPVQTTKQVAVTASVAPVVIVNSPPTTTTVTETVVRTIVLGNSHSTIISKESVTISPSSTNANQWTTRSLVEPVKHSAKRSSEVMLSSGSESQMVLSNNYVPVAATQRSSKIQRIDLDQDVSWDKSAEIATLLANTTAPDHFVSGLEVPALSSTSSSAVSTPSNYVSGGTNNGEKTFRRTRKIGKETDEHRIKQRDKQLQLGKKSEGYTRYTNLIPKWKRQDQDPVTPDKYQICSKRSWDGQMSKWRRLLHAYDENPTAAPVPPRKERKLLKERQKLEERLRLQLVAEGKLAPDAPLPAEYANTIVLNVSVSDVSDSNIESNTDHDTDQQDDENLEDQEVEEDESSPQQQPADNFINHPVMEVREITA